MSKNLWDVFATWQEAEQAWDVRAREAALKQPLNKLKQLPKMVGITDEAAKNFKWKSAKWMVQKDDGSIFRGVMRHPLKYGMRYLRSLWRKQAFARDGDFFLYGVQSTEEFAELLSDTNKLFVLGFSYCHKPFECPSGRFTPDCVRDETNLVCQQCFIGKSLHAASARAAIPLIIPTVHYVGKKIFEIVHANPSKEVLFLITACEMTLTMFADWGNMVGIRGIGVRLDGRICNTMEAFALSEEGVKPGLTVVLGETQQRMLNLIQRREKRPL